MAAPAPAPNTPPHYPAWLSDTTIDPAWIESQTGLACLQCTATDRSNARRKGATVREGTTIQLALQLKGDDGTTLSLMLNQVPAAGRPLSVQLGLAREALFYRNFRDRLPLDILPRVYYAYGDAATGAKVILMEDLSAVAVDSGVLFGPGNPNNWHRDDLTAQAVRAGNVPAHVVALETFRSVARIHARFWKDASLLEKDNEWLRGQQWIQGRGKASWEASQAMVHQIWE
jgi:hypothetical protein